ncbi:recQ-mediated genome instability protein [Sarcoptes scabiei]|nr:recQ-mediated genome instability protein [Sarcoptes scabiei]
MVFIRNSSGKIEVTKFEESNRSITKIVSDQSPKVDQQLLPLCWICCDKPIDCVLLDCGHLVTCLSCARNKIKLFNRCPICRSSIVKTKKIYLA